MAHTTLSIINLSRFVWFTVINTRNGVGILYGDEREKGNKLLNAHQPMHIDRVSGWRVSIGGQEKCKGKGHREKE